MGQEGTSHVEKYLECVREEIPGGSVGERLLPTDSADGCLAFSHRCGVSELVAVSTLRAGAERKYMSWRLRLLQTNRCWRPRECMACCTAIESTTVLIPLPKAWRLSSVVNQRGVYTGVKVPGFDCMMEVATSSIIEDICR